MFKSLIQVFGSRAIRPDSISADELLRIATQKRDDGDIDSAIDLLRTAYAQIASGRISYPVSTFLRLPLYLQQAGRTDEAWREFHLLLTHGFPNQLQHPDVVPMEHCEIYDKVRLFLQRERKFDLAVRFGVLSYISWGVGLHRQRRKAELRDYVARENIENNAVALLKKAKKLRLKDELVTIILDEAKQLPNVDLESLGERIDAILSH